MKTAIKKKWVRALRSGKYKKGICALRTLDNKFCCLGVLTDLYVKESPKTRKWKQIIPGIKYAYKSESAFIPSPVMRWAGIKDSSPVVPFGERTVLLTALNDGGFYIDPQSFQKIASLIEESDL